MSEGRRTVAHLAASPFFGGPERQMLGLAQALPEPYHVVFCRSRSAAWRKPCSSASARRGLRVSPWPRTRHYQAALRRRPSSSLILRRAIDFYQRLDMPNEAEPLLRRLLALQDGIDADRPWARRQLALLLAFRGDANLHQAEALLEQNRQEGEEGLAERRARALVKRRHPEQRQAGLHELEALRIAPLPPDEQYRLIRLYEASGSSTTAREQMEALLARDPKNPTYLAHHVQTLLAAREADAERYLERLARLEPDSPRVKQFRQQLAALEES